MVASFDHRVEIVDDLPVLIQPFESYGELVWLVRRDEMTDRLCEQVNHYLTFWAHSGLSAQGWYDTGSVTQLTDAAGSAIEWIRIEFVGADKLPAGTLAEPRREGDGFVWRILRGEMTEDLRKIVETLLARYLQTGALHQEWGEPDAP
ncbi:hypothetical protein [Streptomyces alkaliterrae]|uniref:Uncharacterized protein n=1 Tax=Streptomyces alkaliterrae TaxID=2213162 RepID=A0A5P0YP50_9ACTN|nr:hypothetical protein [Streptomyces alkaliterrae]MBB1251863.1 hypothetical protein [Streptomyces alkaliterrae]MBB1259322.1 hypothetical protein [Streptomyces alkaliterrae]MQS00299.1 hypothetical protein [Streptomyces alkaliterrae]